MKSKQKEEFSAQAFLDSAGIAKKIVAYRRGDHTLGDYSGLILQDGHHSNALHANPILETYSCYARNTHATLMTTLPVARPDSEYARASRTCSSGNTLSTSGLIAPLSTSRVISLSCSPSARMNRYS